MSIGDPPDANGAGHVDAILRAVEGQRVAAILCTHTHRDHSPAATPLTAATGAPIIGCPPLVLPATGPRADSAFDPHSAPRRLPTDRQAATGRASARAGARPGGA